MPSHKGVIGSDDENGRLSVGRNALSGLCRGDPRFALNNSGYRQFGVDSSHSAVIPGCDDEHDTRFDEILRDTQQGPSHQGSEVTEFELRWGYGVQAQKIATNK